MYTMVPWEQAGTTLAGGGLGTTKSLRWAVRGNIKYETRKTSLSAAISFVLWPRRHLQRNEGNCCMRPFSMPTQSIFRRETSKKKCCIFFRRHLSAMCLETKVKREKGLQERTRLSADPSHQVGSRHCRGDGALPAHPREAWERQEWRAGDCAQLVLQESYLVRLSEIWQPCWYKTRRGGAGTWPQ